MPRANDGSLPKASNYEGQHQTWDVDHLVRFFGEHGIHPIYNRATWDNARRFKQTDLSYWPWVANRIAAAYAGIHRRVKQRA